MADENNCNECLFRDGEAQRLTESFDRMAKVFDEYLLHMRRSTPLRAHAWAYVISLLVLICVTVVFGILGVLSNRTQNQALERLLEREQQKEVVAVPMLPCGSAPAFTPPTVATTSVP